MKKHHGNIFALYCRNVLLLFALSSAPLLNAAYITCNFHNDGAAGSVTLNWELWVVCSGSMFVGSPSASGTVVLGATASRGGYTSVNGCQYAFRFRVLATDPWQVATPGPMTADGAAHTWDWYPVSSIPRYLNYSLMNTTAFDQEYYYTDALGNVIKTVKVGPYAMVQGQMDVGQAGATGSYKLWYNPKNGAQPSEVETIASNDPRWGTTPDNAAAAMTQDQSPNIKFNGDNGDNITWTDTADGARDSTLKQGFGGLQDAIVDGQRNLLTAQNATRDTVNSKTDTLNNSVGQVKASVDAVNASVGQVKSSVDAVNASVGQVKASVDVANGYLAAQSTKLDQLHADNGQLKTSVDAVKAGVDGVNVGVGDVKAGVEAVKTSVDGVKTGVDAVKVGVDGVNTALGTIQGKLSSIYEQDGQQYALIEGQLVAVANGETATGQKIDNASMAIVNEIDQESVSHYDANRADFSSVKGKLDTLNTTAQDNADNTAMAYNELTALNAKTDLIRAIEEATRDNTATANQKLDSVNTSVANVKASSDAVKGALDTANAKLDAANQLLTDIKNKDGGQTPEQIQAGYAAQVAGYTIEGVREQVNQLLNDLGVNQAFDGAITDADTAAAADLGIGTGGGDFWKVEIPRLGLASGPLSCDLWSWIMSPSMSAMFASVNSIAYWVVTAIFFLACFHAAQNSLQQIHQTPQAHASGQSAGGTNLNAAWAQALAIIITALIAVLPIMFFEVTSEKWSSLLEGPLSGVYMGGVFGHSLEFANRILPLQYMVSLFFSYMAFRLSWAKAYMFAASAIRHSTGF